VKKHVSLFLMVMIGVVSPAFAGNGPVRIFILAGQSNMEGKGSISHLDELVSAAETAETYKHLKQGGAWVERDDVRIKFFAKSGKLTVGYGVPSKRFGPELQFGHVVGDAYDEPILIIKHAKGGSALATSWHPPTSSKTSGQKIGKFYKSMIHDVNTTTANLKRYVPDYDGSGFIILGLIWFQGFNDVIKGDRLSAYEVNLVNFIKDVRTDLGVPDLPVVVGEFGTGGVKPKYPKHLVMRKAQKGAVQKSQPAQYVETARLLYTGDDGKKADGGYHYLGRADNFFNFGDAFGKSAVEMAKRIKGANHEKQLKEAYEKAKPHLAEALGVSP